jgi:hypothetical protein
MNKELWTEVKSLHFTLVYISDLTRIFKFIILRCDISACGRQNLLLKCSFFRGVLESSNAKYGNVTKEFMNTEFSLSQKFRNM